MKIIHRRPGILLLLLASACVLELPSTGSDPTGPASDTSEGRDPPDSGSGMVSGSTTATATETSTDEGVDSGSTSAGSTFIDVDTSCLTPAPDGTMLHCIFECDVNSPDHCPDGDKCMPWANDGSNEWNATRCAPLAPELVPLGAPCTVEGSAVSGLDDCEQGAMCWGVDPDTLMGTCKAFCDHEDQQACAEPDRCIPLNDGNVPVCLTPCNPLDEAACAEDEACRLVDSDGLSCLPLLGGDVEGSSAECGRETCTPDMLCVTADLVPSCGDACCTPWCDLSDPGADATCAAADPALACMAFYEPGEAPAGQESLGVCIEPLA